MFNDDTFPIYVFISVVIMAILMLIITTERFSFDSPNKVNLYNTLDLIRNNEGRSMGYYPRQESYRPGDGRVNGYIASQASKLISSKSENYTDKSVPNVLANISYYEKEHFIPEMAASGNEQRNRLMSMEDQNSRLGEGFDSDKRSYNEERFLPGYSESSDNQLAYLMNMEDQSYPLGDGGFFIKNNIPGPGSAFKEGAFKEQSIETPLRSRPVLMHPIQSQLVNATGSTPIDKVTNLEYPVIKRNKIPESLTSERNLSSIESARQF